jgi:hypothetical protein
LLDDEEGTSWLEYEVKGYQQPLDSAARRAARRSGRIVAESDLTDEQRESGRSYMWLESAGSMEARVAASKLRLGASSDASVSVSSSNPSQYVVAPSGNARERTMVQNEIVRYTERLEPIMGAVYDYVMRKAIELRFGDAVEDALGTLRERVDASIAVLVPRAATKLASAFENASSGQTENWANAAATCRRIIKDLADSLRPAGPSISGRAMSDEAYINRLVDWIENQGVGGTLKDVIVSDLSDFGKRIDAFAGAGHKGAHSEVSKYEASRAITGTLEKWSQG